MKSDSELPEIDGQSPETIHALLGNQRRHYAITAIAEREPPITLDELASAVIETETGSGEGSATTTEEVGTALHHHHLSKLNDADVIDYDVEENTITSIQTEALTLLAELVEDSA